ncbi:cobyric acid synthase [Rhodococcus aerolatus]
MTVVPGPWGSGVRGALLVAGTTSDAGKSVLVAGLCRSLARAGVSVAPFKAQNMSNNSAVTPDGGEIGRAQALQAQAAGLEPRSGFNPVLLKPGSDRTSQLVVQGRARGQVGAQDYHRHRAGLADVVAAELDALRTEFDVVVCEGAGSPAEINLRGTDLANMGLARRAQLPVVVVGDIDRGGVLAHLFGTTAVLSAADQALVCGFVVNKFRGDPALLAPGLDQLRALTGRPTLGVVPFAEDLWVDAEDSLGTLGGGLLGRPGPPRGTAWLRVAAVRLPRISNSTDVEALAAEDGVAVRWATDPAELVGADLVVLPGSKSTVADLAWLRRTGLAGAVTAHAAAGRPVLGVCGGYQMLGRAILDEVESGVGAVTGLGLLDVDVRFEPAKVLARVHGRADGHAVTGYEIHHGRVTRTGDPPLLTTADGAEEGSRRGAVHGTHWHGLLANDAFRRRWLTEVAAAAGRDGFVVAPDVDVTARRDAQLDLLADLVEAHLDLDALATLLRDGPTPGLPFVPPGTPDR